jgi:hypothetical protein
MITSWETYGNKLFVSPFSVELAEPKLGDGNQDAIRIDAQGSSCGLSKCGT